jgi:uncharacterized delta-60 repeat protein
MAFMLALLSGIGTIAAPGDLDPSFAGVGTSRVGFGGGEQVCYAAAVQADSKLVLAGTRIGNYNEFEIVRFDTNNVLDASFGAGGVVFTAFKPVAVFAQGASALALKIQADGKIIAAGWSDSTGARSDFALARYNPDGSLDPSFGLGGLVVTDLGNYAAIRAMQLPGDGTIVVAGSSGTNFALARYLTNGVLDASFGTGGTVVTDVGGGFAEQGAQALLVVGEGKVVAAGTGLDGSAFAVTRYTTNGALDSTFGSSGKVFTVIPGYVTAYAHAIGYQFGNFTVQNPDKLVVAGSTFNSSLDAIYAIVRYNLDGTLDSSFGSGGILKSSFSATPIANVSAILVQGQFFAARKITVAGFGVTGNSAGYFAAARYNGNGTPDTTFGGTGVVTLPLGASGASANALAMQAGGLVLAGYSSPVASSYEFAAARFTSSGVLDTTFGNNGVVTADVGGSGSCQGVAIQADGKMVLAGSSYGTDNTLVGLARYNPDGTLDASFGTAGRVTTLVNATNTTINAVAVQSDGRIVVAGYTYTGFFTYREFALVRYNANGTIDGSFGSGGVALTSVGGQQDLARAIALQTDGKLVVAGSSFNGVDNDFAVVRYTTNGSPDSTFAGTGKVITSLAGGEDVATALGVQPDGNIVVAGYARVGSNTNFALVRFTTAGALDNSFGTFGRVSTDFGPGNLTYAYGLAFQPDRKILVAGALSSGSVNYLALARYQSNGLLDPSFGSGGKVTTQVGLTYDQAKAVAVQPDSRIVVAGLSYQGGQAAFAVVRYDTNGVLDPSFGIGGKVIVSFQDGGDTASAVALDQIGRAVVGGYAAGLYGIARLQSEPFLKITSLNRLGNGHAVVRGLGVPLAGHTLHSSTDLGQAMSVLDAVTPDAGGFWQYDDAGAVSFDSRFYRLSFP